MALKFIWKHCKRTAHALSTALALPPLSALFPHRSKPKWTLTRPWLMEHDFSIHEIGAIGEDLAVAHLRKAGLKLLYRNFDPQEGGEIDLIARDGETLCFIEVKTRVVPLYRPLTAVDEKKRRYLRKGATQYLHMLPSIPPYRFDVIEVMLYPGKLPQCNHVREIKVR